MSKFASKSPKVSCFSVVDSHGKSNVTLTYGKLDLKLDICFKLKPVIAICILAPLRLASTSYIQVLPLIFLILIL